MLFVLDDSIIDRINSDTDVMAVCERLAYSYRQGDHLLFASYKLLKVLRSNSNLGTIAKSMYNDLFQSFPQLKSYFSVIKQHVKIHTSKNVFVIENIDDQKILHISANIIADTDIFQKCILLCENTEDIYIYDIIAKIRLRKLNQGNVNISFEPLGGGGATTFQQYLAIQSSRSRLCICILDSDRKAPGYDLGKTTKDVKNSNDEKQILCDFTYIEPREVENLIPILVYEKFLLQNNDSRLTGIKLMKEMDKIDKNFIYYFDVKLGIKLFELLNYDKGNRFHAFWHKIIIKMNIDMKCTHGNICDNKKGCTCITISGLGEHILKEMKLFIQSMDINDLKNDIHVLLLEEWERIGQVVLNWCCSSPRKSVS